MELKFSKRAWGAKNYLRHYYSSDKLVYDEVLIFKYIYKFLSNFKKNNFIDFLDFGSGPTIHRLLPFTNYVKNIYVADYLIENLNEVKLWIKNKKGAHDWNKQIEHILKIEYRSLKKIWVNKKIKFQKEFLRKKIRAIIKCDAFRKNPLYGSKKSFDLVTSFYCIDSITRSKTTWAQATKNLLGLVNPGGWIIIAALRNTSYYMVDQVYFPSPNVNERDFRRIFAQSNFDLETVNVKIISAKLWINVGIKSLIILSAQKLIK